MSPFEKVWTIIDFSCNVTDNDVRVKRYFAPSLISMNCSAAGLLP